jgi:Arc/MetJ-type ribon-helix-helix transcriptional regulator
MQARQGTVAIRGREIRRAGSQGLDGGLRLVRKRAHPRRHARPQHGWCRPSRGRSRVGRDGLQRLHQARQVKVEAIAHLQHALETRQQQAEGVRRRVQSRGQGIGLGQQRTRLRRVDFPQRLSIQVVQRPDAWQ